MTPVPTVAAAYRTPAPSTLRLLRTLLAVAVVVSIVHYADNTFNYDAYPRPTSGPAPSQALVGAAWFGFTAFGLAGYVFLRRGRVTAAAICLAVYSGSGLVGIGHYTWRAPRACPGGAKRTSSPTSRAASRSSRTPSGSSGAGLRCPPTAGDSPMLRQRGNNERGVRRWPVGSRGAGTGPLRRRGAVRGVDGL